MDSKVLYRLVSLNSDYDNIEIKNKNEIMFGRSSKCCDIIYKDGRISGIHTILSFEDDRVYIHDKSTNGTYLNDVLMGHSQKVILQHEDKISIISSQASDSIEYFFYDVQSQAKAKLKIKTPLDEKYCLYRKLGIGSTGVVYHAKHIETEKNYAVKIVDKTRFISDTEAALNEKKIIQRFEHPNIIKCHEIFENHTHIYYILEYARKGDLFDTIIEKEKYTEKEARQIMKNFIKVLKYLKHNKFVHGDLKPENILLQKNIYDIKLCDFEFSINVEEQNTKSIIRDSIFPLKIHGTTNYCSPEVLKGKPFTYGHDVWSLGVIFYILLAGSPPFYKRNRETITEQIINGHYSFPTQLFQFISSGAKDLIKRMLSVNPLERISIEEMEEHPWILGKSLTRKYLEEN